MTAGRKAVKAFIVLLRDCWGCLQQQSSEMYTLLLCVYYKGPGGRRCQRAPVVNDERVLESVLR